MEKRLRKLRNAMGESTFKGLAFSDRIRKQVHQDIQKLNENEEDITIAILHLLHHRKTGYELISLLRARGIRKFEDREGSLYTLLHQMEQNRLLSAIWEDDAKLYQISDRGRKLIRKAEKKISTQRYISNDLLEE
ncbi:PadR family transcriptional regulator [Bacillus sp. REN3]|uniref:PadR family transcriptional regulator n=1 Tax=Bacillus sp. REN3 TaxID=2802440 RepID=UPI001AEEFA61|nr:PadR family transcriptional regulator [Bacillus sp. REN3]